MKIQDLFKRSIHRSINGVVKADQLDASSVWQELDEFVVTRELNGYISDVIAVLLSTIESETNAADKNGIWVSGFFGCGKSHFIKVLSYLLENEEHTHDAKHQRAVDFFSDKLADAMLFADLKKVVAATTETILFNIDSKADHRSGRDALLQVFLKVLNEKQGFSGDHPHIAHMERHLEEKGQLGVFHAAFERVSGEPWLKERDAWEFHRDEVIAALKEGLDQSEDSVAKWVDGGADHFSLTVENFAKWVKRYLDSKGQDHRVMFLADEVGQFIGNDTHLMLNLQTITEQLGTICNGRAWVVVTSQEDLDAVLGDLKSTKQHDFSKIQGRFKTRLSLSSANVDEVIKKRLLEKNADAAAPLAAAYDGKHDILKNQLSFVHAGMSFKTYTDVDDFAACYPFAAYQFSLVQKVFESIRKAGATGLHLSKGERSTLDAFQGAAKQLGAKEVGALAPFYHFYPAVEGFLDTAVKRTIDQASDNHMLKPFDTTMLRVLFLIRYIDELPGSVDNLVTLCVDEIDTDKLVLRKTIEASLARLEGETLIARNGDLYIFLTNEERDIGREIKNTAVPSGAEARELGKLLFEDILGDVRKHTYSATGRDFDFTRLCDDHAVGHKIEGRLEVVFVSPLGDSYAEYSVDGRCILDTSSEHGRVIIRLPDDASLGGELRTYLQTESYVKTKHTGSLPDTTKRVLRDRSEDNRARRSRIVASLRSMLASAEYFASGQKLEISRTDPKDALGDALEYLIRNAYSKMSFIRHLCQHPKQEIQSTLRANDIEQVNIALGTAEANTEALDDLREYIRLCTLSNKQIVLHELINKRYGGRPYGWPELEVVLLVARLAVLKEINLLVNKAPLALDQAYDHLTFTNRQRKVIITQRESIGEDLIKNVQAIGKALFAQQPPGGEEALFAFLKERLVSWNGDLAGYEPLAQTGKYPGLNEIRSCLGSLRKFVEESDSLRFLKRFDEDKGDLQQLAEDIQELTGFYTNQRHSWEKLRAAVEELSQNRLQLEAHEEAGPALARMEEILATPRPYNLLHEVAGLTHTAKTINNELVAEARGPAVTEIQRFFNGITEGLNTVSADDVLRKTATGELTRLLGIAINATSIAHIAQAKQTAEEAFHDARTAIENAKTRPEDPKPRPRRVLEPRNLWSGRLIETEEDMEAFLSKLRGVLEAALKANERVQIK
ncbi:BREX system P-loop protein BrxC [Candidatus Eisenbacteria bacterium]|uniref:BREX system P-loop protein BrxC n=1 Tax=Eiseniibacteriota bacterium TaxID=2212470 RepID=A0ABV6YLJ0_UNCEI